MKVFPPHFLGLTGQNIGVIEVNYGAENLFSEPADARFRPQIGALKLKLIQLKNKGTMNECWLLFHRGSSVNL